MDEQWIWSLPHQQVARVEERIALWGDEALRIWLPNEDAIVRVRPSDVRPVDARDVGQVDRIKYVLFAARLANLAYEDVLIAPSDSAVIPLPHQIRALRRAVSGDRVRYLLADEVGSGQDHRGRPDHPGTQDARPGAAGARHRSEGAGEAVGSRR
jgi:hypothetical protein